MCPCCATYKLQKSKVLSMLYLWQGFFCLYPLSAHMLTARRSSGLRHFAARQASLYALCVWVLYIPNSGCLPVHLVSVQALYVITNPAGYPYITVSSISKPALSLGSLGSFWYGHTWEEPQSVIQVYTLSGQRLANQLLTYYLLLPMWYFGYN